MKIDPNSPEFLLAAGLASIASLALMVVIELVWKPIRGVLHRHDSPAATKADIDVLTQQIQTIDRKFTRVEQYLDDLPQAKNPVLRAAFEEGRHLQEEAYEAQKADKHLEAIDRFTRALPLAEDDSQCAALYVMRGDSYHSTGDYKNALLDYEKALQLCDFISPPEEAARARAIVLMNLGMAYADSGELGIAAEHLTRALRTSRETGNLLGEAFQLLGLGVVHVELGERSKASRCFRDARSALQAVAPTGETQEDVGRALQILADLERLGLLDQED